MGWQNATKQISECAANLIAVSSVQFPTQKARYEENKGPKQRAPESESLGGVGEISKQNGPQFAACAPLGESERG